MSEHDDLSAEEAEALAALSRGPEPPAALEDATVARLRARRLLEGVARRSPVSRLFLAAAAAAAIFAAGLIAGARRATPVPPAAIASVPGSPRFVLLLYDAPGESGLTDAQMGERVAEYRAWARTVRAGGHAIAGEKLGSGGRRLHPRSENGPAGNLGGFFVVSAPDLASALEIARSCPHLKHGGQVEVRPIEES